MLPFDDLFQDLFDRLQRFVRFGFKAVGHARRVAWRVGTNEHELVLAMPWLQPEIADLQFIQPANGRLPRQGRGLGGRSPGFADSIGVRITLTLIDSRSRRVASTCI